MFIDIGLMLSTLWTLFSLILIIILWSWNEFLDHFKNMWCFKWLNNWVGKYQRKDSYLDRSYSNCMLLPLHFVFLYFLCWMYLVSFENITHSHTIKFHQFTYKWVMKASTYETSLCSEFLFWLYLIIVC